MNKPKEADNPTGINGPIKLVEHESDNSNRAPTGKLPIADPYVGVIGSSSSLQHFTGSEADASRLRALENVKQAAASRRMSGAQTLAGNAPQRRSTISAALPPRAKPSNTTVIRNYALGDV